MSQKITITKEWLERLFEANENAKGQEVDELTNENLAYLIGFIESAEYLLKD